MEQSKIIDTLETYHIYAWNYLHDYHEIVTFWNVLKLYA